MFAQKIAHVWWHRAGMQTQISTQQHALLRLVILLLLLLLLLSRFIGSLLGPVLCHAGRSPHLHLVASEVDCLVHLQQQHDSTTRSKITVQEVTVQCNTDHRRQSSIQHTYIATSTLLEEKSDGQHRLASLPPYTYYQQQ